MHLLADYRLFTGVWEDHRLFFPQCARRLRRFGAHLESARQTCRTADSSLLVWILRADWIGIYLAGGPACLHPRFHAACRARDGSNGRADIAWISLVGRNGFSIFRVDVCGSDLEPTGSYLGEMDCEVRRVGHPSIRRSDIPRGSVFCPSQRYVGRRRYLQRGSVPKYLPFAWRTLRMDNLSFYDETCFFHLGRDRYWRSG